ncbi:MAG: hypothetical protein R3246_09890 [Acidimicrobiia bacterium]|nr:hypothetical protein [Acidimicrobiia bacterium]
MIALACACTATAAFLGVGSLLGRRAPSRRKKRRLAVWLVQAGAEVGPAQFIAVSLASACAVFLVFFAVSGSAVVAFPPAFGAGWAPRVYFSRQRARRLAAVREAWPDGLRDLAAGIAAGLSLAQAVEELSSAGPEPLRNAFVSFGIMSRVHGVVPALETIREQLADPTSDRIIEVLVVAHERGGRLVRSLLTDLADATTRDLWTAQSIRTDQLEQKINARAVFALPWMVLLFLTATVPEYRTFYAETPLGTTVVVVAAVLSGLGMLLATRLGRDDDEPRILGGAT